MVRQYDYQAKPVNVQAWKIVGMRPPMEDATVLVMLENGRERIIPPAMMARRAPAEGDYLVRHDDGYEHVMKREAFEAAYLSRKDLVDHTAYGHHAEQLLQTLERSREPEDNWSGVSLTLLPIDRRGNEMHGRGFSVLIYEDPLSDEAAA